MEEIKTGIRFEDAHKKEGERKKDIYVNPCNLKLQEIFLTGSRFRLNDLIHNGDGFLLMLLILQNKCDAFVWKNEKSYEERLKEF